MGIAVKLNMNGPKSGLSSRVDYLTPFIYFLVESVLGSLEVLYACMHHYVLVYYECAIAIYANNANAMLCVRVYE